MIYKRPAEMVGEQLQGYGDQEVYVMGIERDGYTCGIAPVDALGKIHFDRHMEDVPVRHLSVPASASGNDELAHLSKSQTDFLLDDVTWPKGVELTVAIAPSPNRTFHGDPDLFVISDRPGSEWVRIDSVGRIGSAEGMPEAAWFVADRERLGKQAAADRAARQSRPDFRIRADI